MESTKIIVTELNLGELIKLGSIITKTFEGQSVDAKGKTEMNIGKMLSGSIEIMPQIISIGLNMPLDETNKLKGDIAMDYYEEIMKKNEGSIKKLIKKSLSLLSSLT